MTNTVFVHANARQMLGAKISAYSYRRNARKPDSFEVRILDIKDHPRLTREGQTILRAGHVRDWNPDDLQSFTPLRFYPPQAMGFDGRAVITDPDSLPSATSASCSSGICRTKRSGRCRGRATTTSQITSRPL